MKDSTRPILNRLATSLVFLVAFASWPAAAQTTITTVTGTIRDLTGAAVTSGQVTFDLKPGVDTTISGTARFTPQTVVCGISGAGAILNQALTNPCVVVQNTSLQPGGTWYQVCIWPANVKTSCFNWYAISTTVDLSTAVPVPPGSPAYAFVDTRNAQTIQGVKTFTDPVNVFSLTLNGNLLPGTAAANDLGSTSFPWRKVYTGDLNDVFYFVGSASGLVSPPTGTPVATVISSGGTIAAGTYYCVITYGNLNGETPASPQVTVSVASASSRVYLNPGDALWLTGAYKMRAYCGNTTGGPYFLQTPWTRSAGAIGTTTVTSNVATLDTGTTRHGLVDGDVFNITGATDATFNCTGCVITSSLDPTTGNSTITYPFTHANGSTTGGTVNYPTAIETNWHFIVNMAEEGLTLDAIALSGSNPPVTNTATIDPLQVAVNQTRTIVGNSITQGQGVVKLGVGPYALTTPLIAAYARIEGPGREYMEQGGTAPAITGGWTNYRLGVVMQTGPYLSLRNLSVQALATGETNPLFVGYGGNNQNGLILDGVNLYQANATSTRVYGVRLEHAVLGFGWQWRGVNTLGGAMPAAIFATRSVVPRWDFWNGRLNCGSTAGSSAVRVRGGAMNAALGTSFVGIKNGVVLTLDNSVTESCKGIQVDMVNGGLTLENGSFFSDALYAASTEAVVKYGVDNWGSGGSSNIGFIVGKQSSIQGSGSVLATIKSMGVGFGGLGITVLPSGSVTGSTGSGTNVWLDANSTSVGVNVFGQNQSISCDVVNFTGSSAARIINYPTSGTGTQSVWCIGAGDLFANGRFTLNRFTGLTMFNRTDRNDVNGRRYIGMSNPTASFEFWNDDPSVASNLSATWEATTGGKWTFYKNDGVTPLWQTNAAFGVNNLTAGGQIISNVATSTAPFSVASTTEVANLNAQQWHGKQAIDFSASLSFGAIGAQGCGSQTITASNATTGSAVAPAWPPAVEAGLTGIMYVSAAGTVTVRLCNTTAASITPATQTFGGRVMQ